MSLRLLIKRIPGVFYLGISPDMPFAEVQRTFLFNIFLMIGLPFIIPGIPINISNGQLPLAFMNVALLLLYIIGLYVNILRRYLWMRQLVTILATMVAMIGLVFFRNGTEYNMLINLLSGVILFDNITFVLFSLSVIACVTYVRVRDVDPTTITGFAKASPYINIFWSQFLYVLCIYAFKYIYFKYQKQLEYAYGKLKQSNETKDYILRVVAHDLRTPVSGISMLSQMLIENKHTGSEKVYLEMIQKASEQSLSLINDLLTDHAELSDELSVSDIDICELVSHVFELMRHKAFEKQQSLKLSMQVSGLIIRGDREKLIRVIQNIVSNAIKFTGTGGEIVLSVKVVDRVEISVRDNGIGIPDAMQKQLFSVTPQVKRSGTAGEKSFGIGLSVVKQIVDAHQGSITVASREGHGTTISVYLPAGPDTSGNIFPR